jgi:hypothetical protein
MLHNHEGIRTLNHQVFISVVAVLGANQEVGEHDVALAINIGITCYEGSPMLKNSVTVVTVRGTSCCCIHGSL